MIKVVFRDEFEQKNRCQKISKSVGESIFDTPAEPRIYIVATFRLDIEHDIKAKLLAVSELCNPQHILLCNLNEDIDQNTLKSVQSFTVSQYYARACVLKRVGDILHTFLALCW